MTTHRLLRFTDEVFNVPHLVTESALYPILDYLQQRNSNAFEMYQGTPPPESSLPSAPTEFNGIGEIKVDGVITYKPVYGMCGVSGTSYQGILSQAQALIDGGVHSILMTHSSSGGQAAHCFTTAMSLRNMCDAAGVNLISYVDTQAASASLALCVVADEVVIHPSASMGSVGCVVALRDVSVAMKNAGVKDTYITSTPNKSPFAEDGSFSKAFLDNVQKDVTRLGNQFAEHVTNFTGIPVEEVLAMDAKMFHAEAALEVGLANFVMTHEQFAAHMAGKKKKEPKNVRHT